MAETVAVVAAITALFAVVLGPLVSIWVAQRQIRVTVLSANRQTWINTLRDLIAEYLSISALVHAGDWSSRTEVEFDQKLERLTLLNAKIELMLNPNEPDHERLGTLLGDLLLTMGGRASAANKRDSQKARTIHNELLPLSQSVLKREWERVKRVE